MSYNDLTTKQLEEKITELSDKYYNGQEDVSDHVFDRLIELLKQKKPDSKVLKTVGAPIRDEMVKVKLPVWMGSMDKVKEDSDSLRIWKEKFNGPYLVSAKLDGVSGLLEYRDNKKFLYTRGDGSVGQDISYLADFLNLPDIKTDCLIRGEFVVRREIFNLYYAKNYPKARSLISGTINSKNPRHDVIKRIDFIVYEQICDPYEKVGKQFYNLMVAGFEVPIFDELKSITEKQLKGKLKQFKKDSEYEIDGLVVTDNNPHARNLDGNPKYSFAFKVNVEYHAMVEDVEWSPSKYGIIIPRVKIRPIYIQGDKISYSTGFNAKFIKDNKIGPGTELIITKSGDVIPYIVEVTKGTMPKFPNLEYFWSDSEIDIILQDMYKNVKFKKKRLVHLFQTLDVPYISEGMVNKFYDADYDTVKKIYNMKKEDIISLDGIKEKLSDKLYRAIHYKLDSKIPLEKLMVASLAFGFGLGEKRFKIIIDNCKDYNTVTKEEIMELEGFSDKTSEMFIKGVKKFNKFLDNNEFLKYYIEKVENNKSNKKVVFTGFRDKVLEQEMKDKGWNIQSNITKETKLVIAKDKDSNSSKLDKARSLDIEIVNLKDYKN